MRCNHASEGGRHFRTQGHGAFAFIDEMVELANDFVAAFDCKKFQRFQRGAVVFAEAVTAGAIPPISKNILPGLRAADLRVGDWFRVKITEAG